MSDVFFQESIEKFQAMLEKNPNKAYQRYGLSLLYSLSPDIMLKEKERLGFKPESALELYNQGWIYNQEGNHKKALNCYQKALTLSEEIPFLFFNLARTYEELGEKTEARKNYQKYINLLESKDKLAEEDKEEIENIKKHIREL